jgi:hypothetical protein
VIVFDLKCATAGHVFEAWFASSASWEDQRARSLVACPVCGDTMVSKAAMAPNVPAKENRSVDPASIAYAQPQVGAAEKAKKLLAAIAEAQAAALKDSTWVGKGFDRQARAMDAGEIDRASIHGEVTHDEAKALLEDGIGVMPLPLPVVPPEKQN